MVRITDEERIQNSPRTLKKYAGKTFCLSFKLDGSSITIIHKKNFWSKSKFRICSRNWELVNQNNDWHKVFYDNNFGDNIINLVKLYKTNNIVVQGEAIGKFNGNRHALTSNEIRLFNIFVDGKKLKPIEFHDVCNGLKIPICPLYKKVVMGHTMAEVLAESNGLKDCLNPQAEAEGLVWRCVEDNLSFKVINNNYLLNHEE